MVTTRPFLCLLENKNAQTGRTCKYFQLIPPFYWNGAIIIAKCELLFIYLYIFCRTALVKVKQVVYQPHTKCELHRKKTDCGVSNLQSLQVSDQTFSTDTLA